MLLLDRLLDGLDVGVSPFAICDVREGSSLVLQDNEGASLHYVLSGYGLARTMAGRTIELAPHTVMIAPPSSCLVVTCSVDRTLTMPQPKCVPLPGGWQRAVVGDGPAGITLACGAVKAIHHQTTGLFDYLSVPLVETMAEEPAFRDPFKRLLDELSQPKPGTRMLAQILMKECLIALLRRHCRSGECSVPWLMALDHPRLGRAISAMLENPERPFTLQSLAEIAGMSRAAFAERFKEAFGRTAMDLLKEIRLRRAAHLLVSTDLPVKTIAYRVGFASRSHFSRAFKAFSGTDPAGYRAHAPPEVAAAPT